MRQTAVIACKVLEDLFRRYMGDAEAVFLEYGLHRVPQRLAPAIQEQIDRIPPPATIILGYGLCGNGLVGLGAGRHTLVVPRVDDCISILLGSYRRYLEETSRQPGTYYLSKGWLEGGSDPLKEYQGYLHKYDPETARWLIDTQFGHYRRLLFVATRGQTAPSMAPTPARWPLSAAWSTRNAPGWTPLSAACWPRRPTPIPAPILWLYPREGWWRPAFSSGALGP